ncbi:MAG: UTP--glucose-1-phosphate uridylyltransferase [Verrucomicrobiaceae bacterium]|nr:UTP--glucose-1-phosphate uridylyltransferase [Verrucomicrobiaceae bacterium]
MSEQDIMPVEKMIRAGFPRVAIDAFERNYRFLCSGRRSDIPEDVIEPVSKVMDYCSLPDPEQGCMGDLLEKTVVIKLNGGLGTSMGLQQAKSLLEVRDGINFLDMIARQVIAVRGKSGRRVRFLLMNSFSTSEDSLSHLAGHPELAGNDDYEILQSQVPKIDALTLGAVRHSANPQLEWCPPGHGDIFPALLSSGWLDDLLAQGVTYAFISNCDNLGATLDFKLLHEFASSGRPFLMEVTERSEADNKGGHVARMKDTERLVLRESAQCPKEDVGYFQDISRHRFFNTNNLWLRLDLLKGILDTVGGVLPLPVIVNRKTVNPRDPESLPVIQLETAMGAAIGCFEDAELVVVPRARFAPVKNTNDLFAMRSDAYVMSEDARLSLAPERNGIPPIVDLDKSYYRYIDQLNHAIPHGSPSLINCERLQVSGPVCFDGASVFSGCVKILNKGSKKALLSAGTYEDETILL